MVALTFGENFTVTDAGTYYFRIRPWGTATTYGVSLTCAPIVFDCPTDQVNFGDACDDGDPNTSNDVIGTDCICAGTPVLSNDECIGAIELVCNETVDASTVSATQSLDPVLCGGFTASAPVEDVWFSLEADGISSYTIATEGIGAGFDAVLSIYNGTCEALSYLDCADNTITAAPEELETGVLEVGTYYLRVYRYTGEGNFTISLSCSVPTFDCPEEQLNFGDTCDDGDPNTSNDVIGTNCECEGILPIAGSTCETAITVDCNSEPTTYSSVGSTAINTTSCSIGNNGLWFTFAGTGGDITVNSTASFDHKMSINRSSCEELINIVCDDASFGAETHLIANSIPGETYYVYIARYNSGSTVTGDIAIDIDCAEIPLCSAPTSLNTSVTEFCENGDGTFDVEVSLSQDGTAGSYLISNDVNDTETTIASVGSFTFTGFASGTTVAFTASNVDFQDCAVSGSASFTCPPPAPVNDECAGAIAIECGTELLSQSFVGATQSIDDACGGSGIGDVWYSFTTDGANSYIIAETSSTDVVVSLYSGDDCETLIEVGVCKDSPESFTVNEAGTYYFRVRPYFSSGTSLTVSLTCTVPPINNDCSESINASCGGT